MKRNTEELKEKLISVGIEEIRTNGIDRMSMRTIAQKCGVTHGAPYKHFGSKDRYIQVVMEHLSMFFLKNMIQGIDTSIDARTQLTLMGCNFVRFAQEETYLKHYLSNFHITIWSYPMKLFQSTPLYQDLNILSR